MSCADETGQAIRAPLLCKVRKQLHALVQQFAMHCTLCIQHDTQGTIATEATMFDNEYGLCTAKMYTPCSISVWKPQIRTFTSTAALPIAQKMQTTASSRQYKYQKTKDTLAVIHAHLAIAFITRCAQTANSMCRGIVHLSNCRRPLHSAFHASLQKISKYCFLQITLGQF